MDLYRIGEAERGIGARGQIDQGADDRNLLDVADGEAFTTCFRETYVAVHSFVLRTAGADLVEDIVAETFSAVWARWASIPSDAEERRAWVFGVARNKVREADRSLRRRHRLVAKAVVMHVERVADAPEESLLALDRARVILEQLPVDQREAVSLTVLAGLTCAQAAQVLGCSVSAVTSRVSRARASLREWLEGETGDDR